MGLREQALNYSGDVPLLAALLGVKINERFYVKNCEDIGALYIDDSGMMFWDETKEPSFGLVYYVINHPWCVVKK